MTVSINSEFASPYINEAARQLNEPKELLYSVKNNNLTQLEKILAYFSPEIINILIEGECLLSAAIKANSLSIIHFLIQNGARLDLQDTEKLSPLDYAALSSNSREILPAVISEWISRDEILISGYLNDPLLQKNKNFTLDNLKIDINLMNESHLMSLIKTYLMNQDTRQEVLNVLFSKVNEPLDQKGNTLLHLLVQLSPHAPGIIHQLTESLLKMGANPNTTNYFGQTPMHTACKNQSFLINVLSQYQADFFQKDNHGIPPVALISAESLKKDPLSLDSTEVLVASFVVLNQITNLLLTFETSQDLIAGIATVPQLVNYSLTLSQFALLIKKKGFITTIPTITTSILIHAFLSGFSAVDSRHLLHIVSAVPIGIMVASSFKGLNAALKHKNLRPLSAFRNSVVHSINFAHSLYQSANMINNLANHVWHTYQGRFDTFRNADSELKKLNEATNRVKEQLNETNFLSEKHCVEGSRFYKTKLCEELTCIKDQQLLLEDQFEKEILLNQEKIQKINEEIRSKDLLSEIWNFVMQKPSPEKIHFETLQINPHAKDYLSNPADFIKKQYRKLSLEVHPDKCAPKDICELKFNKLSEAYNFFK